MYTDRIHPISRSRRHPSSPHSPRARALRILGIDPGTDRTGYGAVESDGESHRLIEYGVLRNKPSLPFTDKLLRIHTALAEVIERCRPDRVAVESLFYATNVKSALKLGHVRGVALLAGVARGLPVDEYSPLEVKQALVGYGRADKQQVQKMVAFLLDLESLPEPYDAADALAVALCRAHRLRYEQKLETKRTPAVPRGYRRRSVAGSRR